MAVYLDPSDGGQYCSVCWVQCYGQPPSHPPVGAGGQQQGGYGQQGGFQQGGYGGGSFVPGQGYQPGQAFQPQQQAPAPAAKNDGANYADYFNAPLPTAGAGPDGKQQKGKKKGGATEAPKSGKDNKPDASQFADYFSAPLPDKNAAAAPAPAPKPAAKAAKPAAKAPSPAPAPKPKAAPAPAPAAEEEGESWEDGADEETAKPAEPPAPPAGGDAPAISEEEIAELTKMLKAGEISQKDFDNALAGIEEDEEEVVEEEIVDADISEEDPREHVNVVFIGHVDAGD